MSVFYKNQQLGALIGSKSGTTRTAVALTATYDAPTTKIIETGGFAQVVVDINYTMGAAETSNSIEVRVDVSSDGVNFYRIPNESVSAGTSTLTVREFTYVGVNAAAAPISLALDVMYRYMRFAFKETGVSSTYGTVYAEYCLSGL
jgi:hypothetical protein